MTANGQVVAVSPGDRVRERLDDPKVANALNTLLDHADLLAVLVSGLDEFVRRGETISNSLSSSVREVAGASISGAVPGADALKGVDVAGLAASMATLSGALVAATPALNTLLTSRLTDPQAVDVVAKLGDAVVEAKTAVGSAAAPKGLRGLWKTSRDPDIAKGLNFMIQVARSFGRRVGQ